jgi:hypothetical protein
MVWLYRFKKNLENSPAYFEYTPSFYISYLGTVKKMKKTNLIILVTFLVLLTPLLLQASDDHSSHGNQAPSIASQQQQDMFLEKKVIDGYDVSFHVMKASEDMQHGGSHNFMVKIEEHGKVLGDVVINSKVIDPDGKTASKGLIKMGDWYMNGYNLGNKGRYQLMILFKTIDGKKHKGGVYYGK